MNAKDCLLKYPKEFIQGLSEFYPLTKHLLTEFRLVWDWRLISSNTTIKWNKQLLQEFATDLDWHELSSNPSIPFCTQLLREFKSNWHWMMLIQHNAIVNDPDMLRTCLSALAEADQIDIYDHHMAAIGPDSTWAADFFASDPGLDWEAFSAYNGFSWTHEFIREYADKFDWVALSRNEGIPFTIYLLLDFADRWDWFELGYNKAVPWDAESIDVLQDHIDWGAISCTTSNIRWTDEMLISFREKLEWVYLSLEPGGVDEIAGLYKHPNIHWTPALYEALNPTIEKAFAKLAEEEKELLQDCHKVLVSDIVCWTWHMKGANWSEPFFLMLVDKSRANPEKKIIRWKELGHNFSKWKEWSKESIDLIIEKTEPGLLMANQSFPVKDYPDILNKFFNNEFKYNWSDVCQRKDIEFTEALIERNLGGGWFWFSTNANIPMAVLLKYKEHFHWDRVFENRVFSPVMVDAFPAEWARVKRRFKVFQPFNSLAEIAELLFPEHTADTASEKLITETVIRDFANQVQALSDSALRHDLKKALEFDYTDHLLLNVQHDLYWPMLFDYSKAICADSRSPYFVAQLGKKALQFLTKGDFKQSIALYKLILQIDISGNERDLSIYCNALYAIQDDNSGLQTDPALKRQFLKKCMPWATQNLDIYFNAAAVYMELNDLEKVYDCISQSKKNGYANYDQMMEAIRSADMFAPFRQDKRFSSL